MVIATGEAQALSGFHHLAAEVAAAGAAVAVAEASVDSVVAVLVVAVLGEVGRGSR